MRHRKGIVVIAAVVCALALVVMTWFAALRFQSPEQRAAQAQPPAEQPVVVQVVKGELTEQTTLRGQARAAQTFKATLPLSAQGSSIITEQRLQAGEELDLGTAPVWINDRPVIALAGAFPLYRDLGPGDTGSDVRLLQHSLRSLGYTIAVDGEFGDYTARALISLYRSIGASAPERAVTEKAGAAQGAAGSAMSASASATPSASASGDQAAREPSQNRSEATVEKEIYLPLSEVLVVPSLPVRAEAVPEQGTVLSADNAGITLVSGHGQLVGMLPAAVAARISGSVTGTAQLGRDVVQVTGTLERTPATPQAAGSGAGDNSGSTAAGDTGSGQDSGRSSTHSHLVFTPSSSELPSSWLGHDDVLITVDLIPPLHEVLTLPQSAIARDTNGTMTVLRKSAQGTFEQRAVVVSACVAGTCAIEADGQLREGDEVRVDRS